MRECWSACRTLAFKAATTRSLSLRQGTEEAPITRTSHWFRSRNSMRVSRSEKRGTHANKHIMRMHSARAHTHTHARLRPSFVWENKGVFHNTHTHNTLHTHTHYTTLHTHYTHTHTLHRHAHTHLTRFHSHAHLIPIVID